MRVRLFRKSIYINSANQIIQFRSLFTPFTARPQFYSLNIFNRIYKNLIQFVLVQFGD